MFLCLKDKLYVKWIKKYYLSEELDAYFRPCILNIPF